MVPGHSCVCSWCLGSSEVKVGAVHLYLHLRASRTSIPTAQSHLQPSRHSRNYHGSVNTSRSIGFVWFVLGCENPRLIWPRLQVYKRCERPALQSVVPGNSAALHTMGALPQLVMCVCVCACVRVCVCVGVALESLWVGLQAGSISVSTSCRPPRLGIARTR